MDILIKQYNYLKFSLNQKGQLLDKKLKSPLNFQYHYSSFILSSILLKDDEYLNKVLNYYLSIPKDIIKPSNDFNVMLLSLAIIFDENNKLDKEKILKTFYHKSDEELYKLNNNFRALRLVGLILDNKLSNKNLIDKINSEIEWILDLQFDDGFFPDSNMKYKVEKNKGVSHLTYHTKIMMCVGLAYLYTKDKRLKDSFFKALKVLLEISLENYYFFYGRSTNSLFGYGSLYLVFILAYKFSNNKLFLQKANSLLKFLKNYQHKDGHISINLNKEDSKRYGFDGYMYDIVYNAYSNALFLLGNKFLEEIKSEEYNFELDNSKIRVYKNSGFIVYQNKNIKYCLNYKGHQNSLKHKFDSRVSPLSLLYYSKNDKNILSAVSFYPQPILKLVENKFTFSFIFQRIKNIMYKIKYKKYLPLLSGNSFYYEKKGTCFYPYELVKVIFIYDTLILKFKTKSLKKNFYDKCIISIRMSNCINYNIFFYEEVESFFFTTKFSNLKFNKFYSNNKQIKIETSTGVDYLKVYEFKNINKIKVKVL
ncbi:hypothetical protein [Nautilia lithotrophica]